MTTKRRRQYTANFKKRVALEALRGDRTVQAIAAKHEIHPNQVGAWKRQAVDGLEEVFAGGRASRDSEHEATIRDLHAKIGELTVERDFFCAACNAEPRCTLGVGRARRGAEHPAPVRVAGRHPLVGVLHATGRECGEPGVDAADGRIVVAVPVLRQPADGAPSAARGRGCGTASGPPADAPDGAGSALPQAAHEQFAAGAPHLSVPASRPDDRPPGPRLVCRYHLHSGVGGLPVPGRGHGLGQPSRAGLAVVEHDGHRLLHPGAGSSAWDRHAGDLQHRSGSAVYQRGVHRAGAGGGRAMLDGRPGALPGQRLHRAAVAVAEVRSGVSARADRRIRGRAGDRGVDDVLQRTYVRTRHSGVARRPRPTARSRQREHARHAAAVRSGTRAARRARGRGGCRRRPHRALGAPTPSCRRRP